MAAKRLIVTGDDFGLAVPVNEAIEEAHRRGVLRTASLMVGEPAAADAIERARRSPGLRVGLHLVVAAGRPVLEPARIPDLVDEHGRLPDELVPAAIRLFLSARCRRQLRAEIRAQFEAFARTGLTLDHVNVHNHLHLHPTVLGLLLEVGGEFGLRAVRLPREPGLRTYLVGRRQPLARLANSLGLGPWASLVRARLRRAGLATNDRILGLADTGRMDEQTVLDLLDCIPAGVTEMYFHPATRRCAEIDRSMPGYLHEAELGALLSPRVRARIEAHGIELIAFADLPRPPP